MPTDPTVVRVEIISTSPSQALPSGVRTSTGNVVRAMWPLAVLLGGLEHVLDRALEQEGALRDVVVLAVDDLLERADRLLDRHVLAGGAGEGLRDVERLRQEALDLTRALDYDLVLVRELVDAEDRDDVLELLVALQDLLDARRDLVVLLTDDARLEDRRGRVER